MSHSECGLAVSLFHVLPYRCLAGDARNEVMTTSELSKLKFDPTIYRANALQGLVYDPASKSDVSSLCVPYYGCTISKHPVDIDCKSITLFCLSLGPYNICSLPNCCD